MNFKRLFGIASLATMMNTYASDGISLENQCAHLRGHQTQQKQQTNVKPYTGPHAFKLTLTLPSETFNISFWAYSWDHAKILASELVYGDPYLKKHPEDRSILASFFWKTPQWISPEIFCEKSGNVELTMQIFPDYQLTGVRPTDLYPVRMYTPGERPTTLPSLVPKAQRHKAHRSAPKTIGGFLAPIPNL
jgi:hypothetical protein